MSFIGRVQTHPTTARRDFQPWSENSTVTKSTKLSLNSLVTRVWDLSSAFSCFCSHLKAELFNKSKSYGDNSSQHVCDNLRCKKWANTNSHRPTCTPLNNRIKTRPNYRNRQLVIFANLKIICPIITFSCLQLKKKLCRPTNAARG